MCQGLSKKSKKTGVRAPTITCSSYRFTAACFQGTLISQERICCIVRSDPTKIHLFYRLKLSKKRLDISRIYRMNFPLESSLTKVKILVSMSERHSLFRKLLGRVSDTFLKVLLQFLGNTISTQDGTRQQREGRKIVREKRQRFASYMIKIQRRSVPSRSRVSGKSNLKNLRFSFWLLLWENSLFNSPRLKRFSKVEKS